jgi:hypothetical protein
VCLELDGRAFVLENRDEANLAKLAAVFGELFGVRVEDERSSVPSSALPFGLVITLVQLLSLLAISFAAGYLGFRAPRERLTILALAIAELGMVVAGAVAFAVVTRRYGRRPFGD